MSLKQELKDYKKRYKFLPSVLDYLIDNDFKDEEFVDWAFQHELETLEKLSKYNPVDTEYFTGLTKQQKNFHRVFRNKLKTDRSKQK